MKVKQLLTFNLKLSGSSYDSLGTFMNISNEVKAILGNSNKYYRVLEITSSDSYTVIPVTSAVGMNTAGVTTLHRICQHHGPSFGKYTFKSD